MRAPRRGPTRPFAAHYAESQCFEKTLIISLKFHGLSEKRETNTFRRALKIEKLQCACSAIAARSVAAMRFI